MFLILSTEEKIDFLYDQGIGNIVASYDTAEDASADIEKFTPEAVREVKIYDDNENLIGEYSDLVFEGAEIVPVEREEEIEGYECHFRLRTKSAVEKRLDDHEDEITELQEAIVEM